MKQVSPPEDSGIKVQISVRRGSVCGGSGSTSIDPGLLVTLWALTTWSHES